MMRHLPAVALLALAGCDALESPTDWGLVGVYDATALMAMAVLTDSPEAPTRADYVWVPPGGMSVSCGPAKSPDGLGVFEAEAMGNGLTPTLAILLESTGEESEVLTPRDAIVSLGVEEPEFQLRPATMPRYISVRIEGDGALQHKQLIRTQLEMELCMEHKTGHGWIGGDQQQLRQAFLLDPPDDNGPADRRYFGGQRDPVPAHLGPPDACIQFAEGIEGIESDAGRGDGALHLTPADVWGASLRECLVDEVGGSVYTGPGSVPLSVGVTKERPERSARPRWRDLVVTIHGADDQLDVMMDVQWDGEYLMQGEPMFSVPKDEDGNPTGPPGLKDVLEMVPLEYPLVRTHEREPDYTVLLVPNWQVVEGLRRMDRGDFERPLPDAGAGIQDGVGYILDHPELLFVQLTAKGEPEVTLESGDLGDDPGLHLDIADPPPAGAEAVPGEEQVRTVTEEPEDRIWMNVTEPLAGGPLGLNRWGYSPGMLAGRAPVVLFGRADPSWGQVMLSHNTALHAAFLGSFGVLGVFLLIGFQRARDLWSNVPEERIAYWPGEEEVDEDEDAPDVPDVG